MRPIGRSGVRIPAGARDFLLQFFSDWLCGPSGDPVIESQQGQEIIFCNFFLTGYAARRAIRCSNPSSGKRLSSALFFSDRLCSPSGDPVFESQQGQ